MENTPVTERANILYSSPARLTIGFMTDSLTLPYEAAVWSGVADAAREHGVNLLCVVGGFLQAPHAFDAQANALYDVLCHTTLDGLVILCGTVGRHIDPDDMSAFCQRYHPLPIIGIETSPPDIPSVSVDNYQGVRAVTDHLITVHNHRRLAFIRGPAGHPEAEERYRGYIDALADHNLPLDLERVAIGDFTPPSGESAIRTLLDQRQVSFDAIVAANDDMAIGALEALQMRGIHVPDDVAVAGFDNVEVTKSVTPPLTTVRQPMHAQGRRAVELLLTRIAGGEIPQRVTLPTEIVVRQSCGCTASAVMQAAAGSAIDVDEAPAALPAARRAAICTEMRQCIEQAPRGLDDAWVERVFDAFFADYTEKSSGLFPRTVDNMLRLVMTKHGDVDAWHGILSTFRRLLLPCFGTARALARAEDLWQQARVVIAEIAQRVQRHQIVQVKQQSQILAALGQELISTSNVQELMNILADKLPHIHISRCYLALYDDPATPGEWSRLMLAYDEQGRIDIETTGQHFRSHQLAPEGMLPRETPYSMIVEPLYFREKQLGFVLFEEGLQEGMIYDTLRGQISSAVQGALLVGEIARQKYILDSFMKNIPDSIYFKDRESRFIRANRSLSSLFGVSEPTELVGKSEFDFFPEEQARPKYEQERQIMHTGQPLLNFEEPYGQGRWALTTKMPLQDEHGAIIGTFGMSRDITALKQAQAALHQAYSEISTLNDSLREENVRMSAELDVARRIQQMVLPRSQELQQVEGVDIAGYMRPADEVGGDYYDVLRGHNGLYVSIGDVTGHGLESGVLMLMTQMAIRVLIEHGETDPAKMITTLNRAIYKNVERMGAEKTLTLTVVHCQEGCLKIVGQHEDVLVVRRSGSIERLDTLELGFPIGMVDDISQWVAGATVTLQPGDGIVLYTDGFTEAENECGEQYGIERLCEVVSRHWERSVEDIQQAVIHDILSYIGQQKVYDDLTLVVLKQQE